MRPPSSSALRPLYCPGTAVTGVLIDGEMSGGARAMRTGLTIRIRRARTMKVYGLSRAIRTIHMTQVFYPTRSRTPWASTGRSCPRTGHESGQEAAGRPDGGLLPVLVRARHLDDDVRAALDFPLVLHDTAHGEAVPCVPRLHQRHRHAAAL